MEDEIVKSDKRAKYAAAAEKRKATWAAKRAAAELPKREHKVIDDEVLPTEQPSAPQGSRLNSRTGHVEAVGRDGEVLSRTQQHVADEFEIPRHKWPKDWEYQWNTISVHGNADIVSGQYTHMQAQGWRPVPAERYAGDFLPRGAKGSIVKKGMILEERPAVLGIEARSEELAAAKRLISDRNESLKLAAVGKGMPDGFRARNDVSGVRMQIDKSLDVLNVNQEAGQYTLDK